MGKSSASVAAKYPLLKKISVGKFSGAESGFGAFGVDTQCKQDRNQSLTYSYPKAQPKP